MTTVFKTSLATLLVGLLLGAVLAKYYWPSVRVQTIVKEAQQTENDVQTRIETVEKDGETRTVTTIIDKSKQTIVKETQHTEYAPDWIVGVGAVTPLTALKPAYTISVSRHVFGPFFAGLQAITPSSGQSTQFGVIVQAEF